MASLIAFGILVIILLIVCAIVATVLVSIEAEKKTRDLWGTRFYEGGYHFKEDEPNFQDNSGIEGHEDR